MSTKNVAMFLGAGIVLGLLVLACVFAPTQTHTQYFADDLETCIQGQYSHPVDLAEPTSGPDFSIARLLGSNKPSPPPIVINTGRSPGHDDGPDLSSPDHAVQAVLSLIDQDSREPLASCFVSDMKVDAMTALYPDVLSHPISLVEVLEAEDSARVIWEATVQTKFAYQGIERLPGDRVTLTARLVRMEEQWKLIELYEVE